MECLKGPSLGLLFLMYINDLPNSLTTSSPRMYADDTNITLPVNCIRDIEKNPVNSDLMNIKDWLLSANKLSLNVTKTEYMLIASKYRLENIPSLQLRIDSTPITRVQKSESVGVWIDEKLTWSENIDSVAKKISRAIGGLRQIGPFVTFHTLLMIYKSQILPLFDYDVVWDNGELDRLQKLQNRAGRGHLHNLHMI